MDTANPAIVLYNIIRNKTDEQTAHFAIGGLQTMIKAESKGEVTNSVNVMENKLETKINSLELKVNNLDEKVNNLDVKFNNLDMKVSNLDLKLNHLDTRFNDLDVKMTRFEIRMNTFEIRMNSFDLRLGELKAEMIDRISQAKVQTIVWVVSVGILQLVVYYLFK